MVNSLRTAALSTAIVWLVGAAAFAQSDTAVFESVRKVEDRAGRYKALEEFVRKFPMSEHIRAARQLLFGDALELGKKQEALAHGLDYLVLATDRPSALNEIAWQLAEHDVYLDSALSFIDRGLAEYRASRGRNSAAMLDTKAWVLYKRHSFADALSIQREAVDLLPQGAEWNAQYGEYYYRLGLYETKNAAGNKDAASRDAGLRLVARCVFFGVGDALPMLQSLVGEKDVTDGGKRTRELLEPASDEYIRRSPSPLDAQANVAIILAKLNIMPERSRQIAAEIESMVSLAPTIEERSSGELALGIIHFYSKEYEAAVGDLTVAQQYASPYAKDVYLYLGESYEQLGMDREAFGAYLLGLVVVRPPEIMERIVPLYKKLYGESAPSAQSLDTLIAAKAREVEDFDSGKFIAPEKTKTVLAELFTGSECKPCAAADIAYDKLLERYDRAALAVLEYHLHIPAPDPMTNADTELRAKYYGVSSTPTSFVDGLTKTIGGGAPLAAQSRFNIYKDAIERRLRISTEVSMDPSAGLSKDRVNIRVLGTASESGSRQLRLRVALAEEGVEYRGSNGIGHHRFVVRKMIGTPEGTMFDAGGSAKLAAQINLQHLQDSLKSYLDAFERRTSSGRAFKEKKHAVNRENLYVVAFVQDNATKEVLQAAVKKVVP
jgi:tetratricopeptide (TPR) repeat protein